MELNKHVGTYAKAYSGAGASLVAQPFSEHVANVAMWGLSLLNIVPPESVGNSIKYIFVALVTGIVIKIVGNSDAQ